MLMLICGQADDRSVVVVGNEDDLAGNRVADEKLN